MTAIECSAVWGGMTIFPKQVIPDAIDAFVAFTDGVRADPASNLVCIFTHMPDFMDVVVVTLYANVDGIEKPPAYDWTYLNYADKSQRVLESYGVENVGKIREAARKYDPAEIFQRLCPGGFKISDVKI
ncbi:hypothetical protein B0T24DRAFT_222372 [Lasiosphaeria ovina]|uniref:Uncharacterized protein n=1 Tax=Lasiosphaeria ovina TaxID=92902 RepID=A0AAE0KHB4_9PEZI|nr:hypothetical protein B0T24DRAFT_222372 [Lasiosphaeria ovina]